MFLKMGEMDDEGNVMIEALKSHGPENLDNDVIEGIIDNCKDASGDDSCDIAYNVAKCIHEETEKIASK